MRFQPVKYPEDAELQDLYRDMIGYGMQGAEEGVPFNAFTFMGERPDLLKGLWDITKGVAIQGLLPPTVKQMIAMTIGMQNDCEYCTMGHTNALEEMGVATEVIKSCASDPELLDVPPPQRAMLKFALKIARDAQHVDDADFAVLREHGLSDEEIIEVIMTAAWSNFLNTWVDISKIPLDGKE